MTTSQKLNPNLKRLNMIIVTYKGRCPKCNDGILMFRDSKKFERPTKFLGCSKFPKCDWTSYKEKI